jgi:hypothetical protein
MKRPARKNLFDDFNEQLDMGICCNTMLAIIINFVYNRRSNKSATIVSEEEKYVR